MTLTLAANWLNIFSYYFINFISSNIQKRSSSFVVQDLTFIFIQANIYVKTYTSLQISRCRQDKTMVSDNFKTNLHHINTKKVEGVQLFHIKMKED